MRFQKIEFYAAVFSGLLVFGLFAQIVSAQCSAVEFNSLTHKAIGDFTLTK